MADIKISTIPGGDAATLDGTETSEITQSGVTKRKSENQGRVLAHKYILETTPSAPSAGAHTYTQLRAAPVNFYRTPLGIHRFAIDPAESSELNIYPSTSTSAFVSTGNSITTVGTISHPTVTTAIGRVGQVASDATGGATAGTGSAAALYLRGGNTGPYQGFSMSSIIGLPDASYNETGASTGSRIFAGFTDQTLATMAGSDNPAGNYCGFFRCHVNGGLTHTNWQFVTKDNTTISIVDAGLAFTAANLYEMHIYCPPGGTTIYWSIRNISSASAVLSGNTSSNLPGTTSLLRSGFQVGTVDAVARNIRFASFRSRGHFTQV